MFGRTLKTGLRLVALGAAALCGCGLTGIEVLSVDPSDGAVRDIEFDAAFDAGPDVPFVDVPGVDTNVPFECMFQTQIPVRECEALIDFYDTTGGASTWANRGGWLASSNPCNWAGVQCADGHVTALVFGSNGVRGTIPSSIGELSSLIEFSVADTDALGVWQPNTGCADPAAAPNLIAALPAEFNTISTLVVLRIRCANMVGPIPPEFTTMSRLREFDVSSNLLTGPIPPSLGMASTLVEIDVGRNSLEGSVPPELGSLALLRGLSINDNSLTGTLPPELVALSELTELIARDNQLSGVIPDELTALDLTTLELGGNGCLTAAMATATWLTGLDPMWNDGC